MTVYNREIALAVRLINKKGQTATWIKNAEIANSSQPWKTTAGTPTTFAVKLVRLPVGNSEAEAFQTLIPGTSVPTDHERVLMAGAVPFTPELNDDVSIGGETKKVKTLNVLQPDGTPILYSMTLL